MDLDIVPIRTVGRRAESNLVEVARELTLADLPSLNADRGTKAPTLQKLRDSHHAVARCLAEGMRPAQIQLVTGYTGSRISILQVDPAFQELVAYYREHKDALYADLHERMASLSVEAIDELRDRLHDDPDSISPGMLLEMLKLTADRTGHGPKTTQVNVNVEIGARLKAARQRAGAEREFDRVLPAPGEGLPEPDPPPLHTVIDHE